MVIICYFDGRIEPNPGGIGSIGVIIRKDGTEILREGRYIGEGEGYSSNVLEYVGLIRCLDFLLEQGLQNERIIIYGDSQLVIMQMKGKWDVRGGAYEKYAVEAADKKRKFPDIDFTWIPKLENEECHNLAEEAVKNHGR